MGKGAQCSFHLPLRSWGRGDVLHQPGSLSGAGRGVSSIPLLTPIESVVKGKNKLLLSQPLSFRGACLSLS